MAKITINILFFLFLCNTLHSQQEIDTTANTTQDTSQVYVMAKSPSGAVLRSAVMPGWGQIYNESYWKAPVVWGFLAFYSYYWIDNNRNYKNYRRLAINYPDGREGEYYRSVRDQFHDQRDLFAIYMGIVYVLNLVDAYVDAHLFDFNVDEDPVTQAPRLNLKIPF